MRLRERNRDRDIDTDRQKKERGEERETKKQTSRFKDKERESERQINCRYENTRSQHQTTAFVKDTNRQRQRSQYADNKTQLNTCKYTHTLTIKSLLPVHIYESSNLNHAMLIYSALHHSNIRFSSLRDDLQQ